MEKGQIQDENSKLFEKLVNYTTEDFKTLSKSWTFPEWLNADIESVRLAQKNKEYYTTSIPEDTPMILYDEKSKHYLNIKNVKEYYDNTKGEFFSGVPILHNEIIQKEKGQKLFLTLPRNISMEKLDEIIDEFTKYLHKKYGIDAECWMNINSSKDERDVIVNNMYVENSNEAKEILNDFISELPEEDIILLGKNLCRHKKSIKKPTIFSDHHESKEKEKLDILLNNHIKNQEEILDILKNSFYTMGDVSSKTINIYNIINPINCKIGNIEEISNDNIETRNLIDFISYIKNKKPEWYTPGEYVPKNLFTKMFNEMYDDTKTTRSLFKLYRKYNIDKQFIAGSKTKNVDLSKYNIAGKSHNSFLAKKL